jgi:hypothetical protein
MRPRKGRTNRSPDPREQQRTLLRNPRAQKENPIGCSGVDGRRHGIRAVHEAGHRSRLLLQMRHQISTVHLGEAEELFCCEESRGLAPAPEGLMLHELNK